MNKKIVFTLSLVLLVSASGCGNSTQIEQLKRENEELRQQLNEVQNVNSPTPTASPSIDYNPTNAPADTTGQAPALSVGETITFEFVDTSEFPNCLTDGTYKCGVDFEPGDYYVLSMYGVKALYDPGSTADDKTKYEKRIIRKFHVDSGQYIKLDEALLIPESEFNPTDWKKYGAYHVGEDLPAGEYKIETITNKYKNEQYTKNIVGVDAAYQISASDPLGNVIQCERVSDRQAYITLHSGEYLMINNARLTYVTN